MKIHTHKIVEKRGGGDVYDVVWRGMMVWCGVVYDLRGTSVRLQISSCEELV